MKWRIEVESSDGKRIDRITMIDPDDMTDDECEKHLENLYDGRVKKFEREE